MSSEMLKKKSSKILEDLKNNHMLSLLYVM